MHENCQRVCTRGKMLIQDDFLQRKMLESMVHATREIVQLDFVQEDFLRAVIHVGFELSQI